MPYPSETARSQQEKYEQYVTNATLLKLGGEQEYLHPHWSEVPNGELRAVSLESGPITRFNGERRIYEVVVFKAVAVNRGAAECPEWRHHISVCTTKMTGYKLTNFVLGICRQRNLPFIAGLRQREVFREELDILWKHAIEVLNNE